MDTNGNGPSRAIIKNSTVININTIVASERTRCPHCGKVVQMVPLIQELFNTALQTIADGKVVRIFNFGDFFRRRLKDSTFTGRSGGRVRLKNRWVPYFYPAATAKSKLNKMIHGDEPTVIALDEGEE